MKELQELALKTKKEKTFSDVDLINALLILQHVLGAKAIEKTKQRNLTLEQVLIDSERYSIKLKELVQNFVGIDLSSIVRDNLEYLNKSETDE